MYGIVGRIGKGSWFLVTTKVFEDKERAEAVANKFVLPPPKDKPIKAKVVYLGDKFDWEN